MDYPTAKELAEQYGVDVIRLRNRLIRCVAPEGRVAVNRHVNYKNQYFWEILDEKKFEEIFVNPCRPEDGSTFVTEELRRQRCLNFWEAFNRGKLPVLEDA